MHETETNKRINGFTEIIKVYTFYRDYVINNYLIGNNILYWYRETILSRIYCRMFDY